MRDPVRLERLDRELLEYLQISQAQFLTTAGANSTRAAGDAIQTVVSEALPGLLANMTGTWVKDLTRRAMGDARITTANGEIADFDVKTHRAGTSFNMPNLTSIQRLAEFYDRDENTFLLVVVSYGASAELLSFSAVRTFPVEWLSWDCLTLGLLGWGQLQIKNVASIQIIEDNPRAEWMRELCDRVLKFYPAEIEKLVRRIRYFEQVRGRWS